MTYLTLAEALEYAARKQVLDQPVVIAAIVASNLASLPAGSRVVIEQCGAMSGEFGPALDVAVKKDALAALEKRRSVMRTYVVKKDVVQAARPQRGDVDIFFEVLSRPPRLIIVGAGHIAVPLARLATTLDFEVDVVDDRAQYASVERFPDAKRILVGPYAETLKSLPLDADTHVVLVTRGHVHDQACLELVATKPLAYIGMIGSKRRVRTVLRNLEEKGFDPEVLGRVHAPVGLDIAAQTPAEIALAIMAEIVKERRGGRARSLTVAEGSVG
jgi:xanthine dehydrogenase accessory factor